MTRLIAFTLLCGAGWAAAPDLSTPGTRPQIEVRATERRGDVEIRDITFDGVHGERIGALLVSPASGSRLAAVLYVHWYDPSEPTSNRLEFLPDAVALARKGQMSLLVETMWSDPAWYGQRVQANDYDEAVAQVRNLRRGLDVLLSDSRVDPARVALVGHDFGGVFGAVTAAADPRVKALVSMTAAAKLSDWYMYGKFKLASEERARYVSRLAPFDAAAAIGRVNCPVLLEFADSDFYVPRESIEAYRKAQPDKSKATIYMYNSGHKLGSEAARDRNAFLTEHLRLREDPADVVLAHFRDGRSLDEFQKAMKTQVEFEPVSAAGDSVTVDLYESSEYLEALGCGVQERRVTFRVSGRNVGETEAGVPLYARLPCVAQEKAFVDWILREHAAEAEKVLDHGQIRMTGDSAAAVLALAKQWNAAVLHPKGPEKRP